MKEKKKSQINAKLVKLKTLALFHVNFRRNKKKVRCFFPKNRKTKKRNFHCQEFIQFHNKNETLDQKQV